MKYTRVLVPLDGSDGALTALGPARRLARLHGAELGVVTITAPDTPAAEAEAIVDAGCLAAGDPDVRAMILRATDVPAELARLDRDHPEFLLCLATSARRPLDRAVLGSVAREVVRHSDQAVALVGPRCDVANTNDIQRLLVCLDGTTEGEAILPWAKRWSTATGVPLALVRVVYPLIDPAARIPPTERQLQELGYASRLARELEQDGYRVTEVVVQHPSTADAITDLAADNPHALLAVSTANAGPLSEVLAGSTFARVVRTASVPVVVARHP